VAKYNEHDYSIKSMNNIMSLKLKNVLRCFLLLASLCIQNIFADSTPPTNVKTVWLPDDTPNGRIILEISNNGEAPISILPYLNMIYRLSEKEDLAPLLTVSEPKTISASVVILEPHPKDMVTIPDQTGQLPKTVEVGVGETKRISFFADKNFITLTKSTHSTPAGFYLFLDGKPISITSAMISNGSWK
jgi:hypothetical protein